MGDAENKPSVYSEIVKKSIYANGRDKWTPVRYSMLYAYVAMYHRVRGNPHLFGLTEDGLKKNSNANQIIYEKVKENFGRLWNDLELDKMGHLMDKSEMYKDLDYIDSHARGLSGAFSADGQFKLESGKMMTMANADYALKIKADKCREKFMTVKNAADYMPNMLDKDGNDKENGYTGIKYEEAKKILQEKKRPLRRSRWKTFAFGLLSVAAAAGTLVGLGALIGGGGALLSGMFGGVMASGTIGGAAAGLVGTIGGGLLAKTFVGKFRKFNAERRALKQDYKDFMRGEGKYVTKEKKPQGYRKIKQQRHDQLVAKAIMTTLYNNFYKDYLKSKKLDASVTLKFGRTSKVFARGYNELQNRKFELMSKGTLTDIEKQELSAITKRINDYKVAEGDIINAYTNYLRTHTREINKSLSFSDDKMLGKLDIRKYISRCIDLREIAKETVYNSQVSDTKGVQGVMAKIQSIIEHKVSWADEVNNETVGEKVENIENAISGARSIEDVSYSANETRASLSRLLNAYETLLLQKDDFGKQNAQSQYIELKRKLCDAIVSNVRSIVDKPLDNQTLTHITNHLQEGSQSLEAIKNSSANGDFEELQSLAAFVEKETNIENATPMISTTVGATISEQLDFSEASMKSACVRMGANVADVEDIVRRISLMTNKSETADIEIAIDTIDTKPENKAAAIYLRYMLKRQDKKASVDLTRFGFTDEFKTRLESLTIEDINKINAKPGEVSKVEQIKKYIEELKIGGVPLSSDDKKIYLAALKNQMDSLSYRDKLTKTADAWPAIRDLRDPEIINAYKRMSEIKDYSEGFDTGEIVTSFLPKLVKYQDTSLGRYMKMKLNEKVASIYTMEASKVGKYSDNLEAITKLLKNVKDSKLLTNVQREQIIATMGKSIETSLQSEMMTLHENLLVDVRNLSEAEGSTRKLSEKYKKYLSMTMLGSGGNVGFKEFFDLKTPESEALKKQVTNLYETIVSIPKFLTVASKGQPGVFDSKGNDARVVINTFYKNLDKGKDSGIYRFASDTDDIYTSGIKKEDFEAATADPTKLSNKLYSLDASTGRESGVLVDLKRKLDEVDSLPADEQLAAIVILKQRCLGLFRAQLYADLRAGGYIPGTEMRPTELNNVRVKAEKQLKLFNKHLFKAVDDKIRALGRDDSVKELSSEIENGLNEDLLIKFAKTARTEESEMGS